MKKRTFLALIIIVGWLGFSWLYIASSLNEGGQTCAQYFHAECKYYDFFEKQCHCEGFTAYLDNEMVKERNEQIKRTKVINSPSYQTNWSFLVDSMNKSK